MRLRGKREQEGYKDAGRAQDVHLRLRCRNSAVGLEDDGTSSDGHARLQRAVECTMQWGSQQKQRIARFGGGGRNVQWKHAAEEQAQAEYTRASCSVLLNVTHCEARHGVMRHPCMKFPKYCSIAGASF